MIWKTGAIMGAFIPVAASALAADKSATVNPENATVRPAVAIVRTTESSTLLPAATSSRKLRCR